MKRASTLLNLPIISANNGQRLEKVRDILYDDKNDFIKAFLVDEGGLLRAAKIVPYSSVTAIGEDAIIVKDENAVVTADMVNGIDTDPKHHVSIKDKTVMTENGKHLGKIKDLEIDAQTGKVQYYIATGGIFQDLYKGQMRIASHDARRVGEDVVFVDNTVADHTENETQGIQGAIAKTGEKAEEIGKKVSQKAQELADNVKEKTQETIESVKKKTDSPETKNTLHTIREKAEAGWEKLKEKTQKGLHSIDTATKPHSN